MKPEQLARRLARNVRRLRADTGRSVESIAEDGDLHWRLWQKVEAGGHNPTLSTLARMASALGVEPGQLLAGKRGGP